MNPGKPLSRRLRGWMLTHVPGMITCREFDGFLVDYLDDTLARGQRRRFDLHLAVCSECRRYLEGYRHTIALARESANAADAHPVPDDVPESLVQAVLSARQRVRPGTRR